MNARHLIGPHATPRQCRNFGISVLSSFLDFILEMARSNDEGISIRKVTGTEQYNTARSLRRGAILLTAHLGSFETAVASLRDREQTIHVVFQRDAQSGFEAMRAAQRRRLGVIEAPIDDSLAVWIRLRDALHDDEVVLLQGDRILPGQSGHRMPFFDGHMILPTGPVKLARLSGAPIVPVFAPRAADGRIDIIIEEPILVNHRGPAEVAIDAAMSRIATVIERQIRAYPEQWLMLHRAWCEDQT